MLLLTAVDVRCRRRVVVIIGSAIRCHKMQCYSTLPLVQYIKNTPMLFLLSWQSSEGKYLFLTKAWLSANIAVIIIFCVIDFEAD